MSLIQKHAREFMRRFRRHDYELTDEGGIFFPRSRVLVAGRYAVQDGSGTLAVNNLVTNQGQDYLLNVALGGQAAQAGWYLALYSNDYTPTEDATAATFPVMAGEITSTTEGYSNATRQRWIPAQASNTTMHNLASPAVFNMVTASVVNVTGIGLLSDSARGSTSGLLLSAAKFRVARPYENGEEARITYTIETQEV